MAVGGEEVVVDGLEGGETLGFFDEGGGRGGVGGDGHFGDCVEGLVTGTIEGCELVARLVR